MTTLTNLQNALTVPDVSLLNALHTSPVLDKSGRPRVVAGGNAFVCHLRRNDGRDVALRIVAPDAAPDDWSVRYSALASLQATQHIRRLPLGIRSLSVRDSGVEQLLPGTPAAQVMEWIPGPNLGAAVDRAVSNGNSDVLRAIAAGLVQMWNDLADAGFTHGDLTSQNLMVRGDGQLVAVDLDTASWRDSPFGSGGVGTPGYRHPTLYRDAAIRDGFAMLVIQASLAAISDNPGLRARFGEDSRSLDGFLLFSETDLADPSRSQAFAEARHFASAETTLLLNGLAESSAGGIDDIAAALTSIPRLRLSTAFTEPTSISDSTWSTGQVMDRVRAHYASTWQAPGVEFPPPPEAIGTGDTSWGELPPSPVDLVTEFVPTSTPSELLAELGEALTLGDEADVLRLWSQLEGNPTAALYAAPVEDVIAASYARRLAAESRAKRDAGVVAIADEAERRQIPLGVDALRLSRLAQERLDVRSELEAALSMDDADALAELAVSGRLVVLGDTDRATLRRVLLAIEWPVLQRAMATDDDHLILAAFDPDLFDAANPDHLETVERAHLAERRQQWLTNARDALARRDTPAMESLMMLPPRGAIDRLSGGERRRMLKAIESRKVLASLDAAILADDESAIVAALNAVERIGARIPERQTWQQIQRVVERIGVLDELVAAANAQPMDHAQIAHLIPTVRALGLERDPRLGDPDLIDRLEAQVVRNAHLTRIRAAISRDNDVAIATAAVPDPYKALDLLDDAERDRVALAIRNHRESSRR